MSLLALLSATTPVRAQQAGQAEAPMTLQLPVMRVEAKAPEPEPEPALRTIGGPPPQGPCVIVDIAGERAGHLDCATQALSEAARTAQEQARAGIDASVPTATSPDVQTGVAHQAATRLRMGSGLGTSVHPERPATRPPRAPRP